METLGIDQRVAKDRAGPHISVSDPKLVATPGASNLSHRRHDPTDAFVDQKYETSAKQTGEQKMRNPQATFN